MDKEDWLDKYKKLHGIYGGSVSPPLGTSSLSEGFSSILPMVRKVVAKTISTNIVSVAPLGMPLYDEDKVNSELKKINRENKIDSILKGMKYEHRDKLTNSELEDLFGGKIGPSGNLFYLDYKYTGKTASKI